MDLAIKTISKNGGVKLKNLFAVLFVASMSLAQAASAQQIGLALLGDSIVDDYLGPSGPGNTNLAAGSFGQVMAETRGDIINFGAYKAPTNDPADAWDEIRNFGYEYNFATAGATASAQDFNFDANGRFVSTEPGVIAPDQDYTETPIVSNLANQIAGLTPYIQNGDIDAALISIGPNDIFFHTAVFDGVTGGSYDAPDAFIDQTLIDYIADAILDGIDALQAAGDIDIVLGELAEVPVYNQEELDAIAAINDIIRVEAAAKGAVVIDLLEWSETGEKVDPETGNIIVGDVEVVYGSAAFKPIDTSPDGDGVFCNYEGVCPLDSHATRFLAEDGIHLNTMMQGLLANEFITAMNVNFGYDIDIISDNELLTLAGIETTVVPVPAAAWLFASALISLLGVKRKRTA